MPKAKPLRAIQQAQSTWDLGGWLGWCCFFSLGSWHQPPTPHRLLHHKPLNKPKPISSHHEQNLKTWKKSLPFFLLHLRHPFHHCHAPRIIPFFTEGWSQHIIRGSFRCRGGCTTKCSCHNTNCLWVRFNTFTFDWWIGEGMAGLRWCQKLRVFVVAY